MHLSERRLRTLIRALLEAPAPGMQGTPSAPSSADPMDAPIEKTPAQIEAEKRATETGKPQFEDDLADLLAKKMKEKGSSEASVNDMKKAVKDGR